LSLNNIQEQDKDCWYHESSNIIHKYVEI